jgi:hypothetical protein
MELVMKREYYPYTVAAVYPNAAAAEAASQVLNDADLHDVRVFTLDTGSRAIDLAMEPQPLMTRRNTVGKNNFDARVGTAAGTNAMRVRAPASPALFVSAPVVGGLIVLGYGAVIGGAVGAIHGLRVRENLLVQLVKDTLKAGYHVIIIHAASEDAQRRVQDVLQTTMAEDSAFT